jgi:hypothetical protein
VHPILASRSRLLPYLGAWLPIAGLLAGQLSLGDQVGWLEAMALAVPLCLVYAFVCLGAWYPCRALPLRRTSLARAAVAHLIGAAVSTGLWIGLARLLVLALGRRIPDLGGLASDLEGAGPLLATGTLLYLLSVALHYLLVAAEESRQAEQRALQAELASREAELEALRAQLDPHFLFNSLNSISSLITSDPAACRQMCVQLGAFLRGTLALGSRPAHPLADELELLRRYLSLERARFGQRLEVIEQIDPGCVQVAVPPLILQPLIENAIKHGIAGLLDGGTVELVAERVDEDLVLRVANPFDPDGRRRRGAGVGLENVRRRLLAACGPRAEMRVRAASEPEHRFTVELRLPIGARPGATPGATQPRDSKEPQP